MNKNVMVYGLVVVGGILAYYTLKEYNLRAKKNAQNKTTPLSQTSGIFVDDVPINISVLGIQLESKNSPFENIKNSVSQIIEPFISTQKQNQLTRQGEFLNS
jgi:hypothetical protein